MWVLWLWVWPRFMPLVMSQRPFIDFAQGLADFQQFLFQHQEDAALDRVGRHEIVDLRRVLLAVTMDAPDPLLKVHRVPGQVVVEQHAGELEVDPLAAGSRANQDAGTVRPLEPFFCRQLGAVVAAFEDVRAIVRAKT